MEKASPRPQTAAAAGGESHGGKKILFPQGSAGSSPALGITLLSYCHAQVYGRAFILVPIIRSG
jgi:hypothetical protein